MQVFKLFFKIVRASKTSLLTYVFVTVLISILFVKSGAMNSGNHKSEDIKPAIAIFDASKSEQSEAFIKHLGNYTQIEDIKEDKIEDALFYRQVAYVLYIPKEYATQLENNEEIILDKKVVDNAAGAYLVDQYIEEYISAVQSYTKLMPNTSFSKISTFVEKDFSTKVKIEVKTTASEEQVQMYFNFFGYTFMCCLIGGIGFVMFNLSRREIKRRNVVAPISSFSMNIQLALAYVAFSLVIFAIATAFAYLIFPSGMKGQFAPFMLLNMTVYLIPSMGMAFLIGSVVHNLEVQNGVANVMCLALAFLGGSFVPQQLMSTELLKIASFTPNYWYVKSNDILFGLQKFDYENLQPVFMNMLILVLFGVAFISIALLLNKHNEKNIK